ncbi:hypothetical protein HK104_007861, partial [Borealophlyctis nickersoniae]
FITTSENAPTATPTTHHQPPPPDPSKKRRLMEDPTTTTTPPPAPRPVRVARLSQRVARRSTGGIITTTTVRSPFVCPVRRKSTSCLGGTPHTDGGEGEGDSGVCVSPSGGGGHGEDKGGGGGEPESPCRKARERMRTREEVKLLMERFDVRLSL